MGVRLKDFQQKALSNMHDGCILCGGTGSGKSITSLTYYFTQMGGKIDPRYIPMKEGAKDLYIITTAMKRDSKEWEKEMVPFLLSAKVDSWNNIKKYEGVKDAFFIFDEQRVVGKGQWVKSFLKICKANRWILLSATPGDTWSDYIPVFIANGFYRNRTEFTSNHIVYQRNSKYPKIDRYINTGRLMRLRNKILVDMEFERPTVSHHSDIWCQYDPVEYKNLHKYRWDADNEKPIETASELCYALRKIVNSDNSRLAETLHIAREQKKVIIFYNFDYELELLKNLDYGPEFEIAEWNGHKHQPIPGSVEGEPPVSHWVYLVQYNAGAEGWNCTSTDTVIFYSQNYSYKMTKQAAGRIDRLNTPFKDLYFYHLLSRSGIDLGIKDALRRKQKFNEYRFINS